jgi:hypothetical protein
VTTSERQVAGRLKRISSWLYGRATVVGSVVGVVSIVGVVYLLRDSGIGPNILVIAGGIVAIGFVGFAAGAILTAILGLLVDLAAYVAVLVGRRNEGPTGTRS